LIEKFIQVFYNKFIHQKEKVIDLVTQKAFRSFEELETLFMHVAKESPTYQKIAIYIEKNYLRIIFMTANELAEKMGVSQGSVSRFFIALGYHGYNEFLRNLQRLVSKQLTAPQRLQYSKEHDLDNPLRTILDVELGNMDELIQIMQGEDYDKMLQAILSDKPLILISARMSAAILPYVSYILHKMRPDVSIALPDTPEWEALELLEPGQVNIIAVAFPRYPNVLIQKCSNLKQKGFAICALTDSKFSPIVSLASASILVSVTTSSLFDIYSTPIAFFNLLLRDAAKQMPGLEARMEKIEEIERRDDVYFTH
jgi:DNA-binding MurR/RpiR family transcriptional regulator